MGPSKNSDLSRSMHHSHQKQPVISSVFLVAWSWPSRTNLCFMKFILWSTNGSWNEFSRLQSGFFFEKEKYSVSRCVEWAWRSKYEDLLPLFTCISRDYHNKISHTGLLKQQKCIFSLLWRSESKTNFLVELVSPKASPFGMQTAAFSLCPHWPSVYTYSSFVSLLCIHQSIGLGP